MLTDEETHDNDLATMVDIRNRMLSAVDYCLDRLVVLGIAAGAGVFEAPSRSARAPMARPPRPAASPPSSPRSVSEDLPADFCDGELATSFAEVLDDVVSACKDYEPVPAGGKKVRRGRRSSGDPAQS